MSMFTLAISCLITSNLPWFMDLTFQIPMQYCYLQHQTLLPLTVTTTTGCCFCFGSISLFFLELFLHWSPVAYWVPIELGSSSFSVKDMIFPVVMYECGSWTLTKAEHQRIDAFELWCWRRLFKSPLDCMEIQTVHAKGNQPWLFTGRTDAEAKTPILWPSYVNKWLTENYPVAGKDWRWEEKGITEDEMVGWHHQLDGHMFE